MSHILRPLFVILLLLLTVPVIGCSSKRRPTTYASPEGIERPAKSLAEEKDASDRAGEILIAVIVVGTALVLIAVPILLFVI